MMYEKIKFEQNSITKGFLNLGLRFNSSKASQSLIHLYNNYCLQNNCLNCEIGNKLLYNS